MVLIPTPGEYTPTMKGNLESGYFSTAAEVYHGMLQISV